MSYGGVENTQEELDLLKGAKILDIQIVPVVGNSGDLDNDPEFRAFAEDEDKIVMKVKLPKKIELGTYGSDETRITDLVTFEIWQDEEGNGPGYIALVDGD